MPSLACRQTKAAGIYGEGFYIMLLWLLLASCVMLGIAGLWIGITYLLTPHLKSPDGKAIVTGSCGDTMEIALKFENGHVSKTSCYTDGCAYSLNCVYAAADLAKGKTPDELLEIDSRRIREAIGGLPKDHLHCAQLAEETLLSALDDYMRKQKNK